LKKLVELPNSKLSPKGDFILEVKWTSSALKISVASGADETRTAGYVAKRR
jgi:hypothetical protein